MYDNPLSGRIANSIVQLMVISGNYRWLLGLRPKPHQGGCSSPLDPRLLPGSMLRIDMAWPHGKYRFQRPLLKSSSGSKGCCGTGFRTLYRARPPQSADAWEQVAAFVAPGGSHCLPVALPINNYHQACNMPTARSCSSSQPRSCTGLTARWQALGRHIKLYPNLSTGR